MRFNLQDYVAHMQFVDTTKEHCYKILDYLYSIYPNDANNAHENLQIQKMDIRNPEIERVDDNTLAISAKITGEAKKVVEDSANNNFALTNLEKFLSEFLQTFDPNKYNLNDVVNIIDYLVSNIGDSYSHVSYHNVLITTIASGEGAIRKRKDGRWEGRIVVGHKSDNKPIYKSVFAKTQKELLPKLHKLIDEYSNIDLTEDSNMQRILSHADCKVVRFHDLRHTFATTALEHGMDVKTLSSIIGHVSSATTLDIYSHVTDSMQLQAANKIEKGIGKNERFEADESPIGKQSDKTKNTQNQADFEPYKGKIRKPGTGSLYQVSEKLWAGKYSPKDADGKKIQRNVFAKTREECEILLQEMIVKVKAEIAEEKERLKLQNKSA